MTWVSKATVKPHNSYGQVMSVKPEIHLMFDIEQIFFFGNSKNFLIAAIFSYLYIQLHDAI